MFNDVTDYQKNWPTDRFPAMRPIWELFKNNLWKYAVPSEYLTIDEALYLTSYQIAFSQNNPHNMDFFEN